MSHDGMGAKGWWTPISDILAKFVHGPLLLVAQAVRGAGMGRAGILHSRQHGLDGQPLAL